MIEKQEYSALVDTGSAVSFIDTDVARACQKRRGIFIIPRVKEAQRTHWELTIINTIYSNLSNSRNGYSKEIEYWTSKETVP